MIINTQYKYKQFYLVLISVFVFFNTTVYSQPAEQGTPFFVNYPPKSYGFENQNFCVVEGEKGLIYFANSNGILEYDGHSWNLIPLAGIPRLTRTENGTVYATGFSDFGKLTKNNLNKTVFTSLINASNKKYVQDINVQKLISSGNNVFLVTGKYVYKWESGILSPYDSSNVYINAFVVNNKLYINEFSKGLFLSEGGKRKELPYTKIFSNKIILEMSPYTNGRMLIKTGDDKGFYLADDKSVSVFNTSWDKFIDDNYFMTMTTNPNGDIVVGTQNTGVIILNEKGELLSAINRQTGLWDDDVKGFYTDHIGNMWLALNNGIGRIEYPSAFSYYKYSEGIRGGVSSITRFGNVIYIATTQGCFYMDKYSYTLDNHIHINHFKQVANADFECNSLYNNDNRDLLVSSATGLYVIQNKSLKKIFDGQTEGIIRSKFREDCFFVGSFGMYMVYKSGNEWKYEKLSGLDKLVRTIAEDDQGNLWLGTDYLGLYQVMLHGRWNSSAPILTYEAGRGLPQNFEWVDVYYTSNGILFSTFVGVFRFNEKTGAFYPDDKLGIDFSSGNKWMFPIIEDPYKNLWFSMATKGNHEKETGIAFTQEKGDHYSLVINPLKKIKDYTLECIFPDSNAVTWFGGFDGLIRFDASCSSEDTLKFNTLLRSVVIGKDSFVFAGDTFFTDPTSGVIEQIIPEFRYRYNHVKFVFAAPFHIRQEDVSYQCYLEGFDKDWQPWTSSNVRDYTFLPEGSYVFHVRAKNIYGTMTEDVKYSFNIKPPLYRHWLAYILYLTALLAFIYMLLKWRSFVDAQERIKLERLLAERTEELVKQKERAEELVANILPKDTAQELVSKGHATRKKYKMVTVLFSDVQGFTQIAEHMNPEKLLDELDRFFLYFDSVVERLGVEKIKTIGDAYMCAGGIPVKNRTNPIDVILGALEIQQYMKILKSQSQNEWDIRIGIHTGPVIAGVVGSKKYTYDIWGDTVNIASRMESTGEAGEINISESTFELVKDYFECEYRGKLPVKYKGEIDMYFVKGILPELSENRDMIHPNREFLSKLQLLRFSDLEELIMTKLDKGLPKNLYYHNVKHTIDVMVQTEILAISERVTREEMLLLKTASLFHDTGFLIGYDDHEFLSIKMAKDILPQYMYSEEQIAVICDLIFVTKLPPVPRNKLEMIMCDADLDYLGRNDFIPVSQNLFREMYERGKIRSIEEWNRQQYSFISQHNYFTETAQKIREVNKQEVLKELKKMIE